MSMRVNIFVLIAISCICTTPLLAHDATTALLERLDKGDCAPSSLSSAIWTILPGPAGTHGALNWGDELLFEPVAESKNYDTRGTFNVWKNGSVWKSASGWQGSCVRDGNLSVYVVTGTIELGGCLHELAIGRLDHDDGLSNRIEVVFEHAHGKLGCDADHGDAVRHLGHAHGSND